jgi:hypothetical protein
MRGSAWVGGAAGRSGRRIARSARPVRLVVAAAVCLALTGGACSAAASSSASGHRGNGSGAGGGGGRGAHVGRRDVFRGSVISGDGAYAGDSGRVELSLHPHGAGRSRLVRIVLRGLPCQGASRCLALSGVLRGVITEPTRQNPDVGQDFSIIANGRITGVGRVTSDGNGHGTGFIRRAREILQITLINRSGRITVRARSHLVRGFSSP